jgi:anti-sigma factor RsiW
MRERFQELLPFYVNGTLSADDRRWMDEFIAAHPTARAELEFFRALRLDIQESAPKVPATIGLAKTMQLIRGDQPTWSERISAFLSSFGMRPAMALTLAVVAVQAGVIMNMLIKQPGEEESYIRSGTTVPVTEGPVLKVSFAADAKEADIRFALIGIQGSIADGPSQLGDYYIRVPAGTEQTAAGTLRASAVVQAVEIAPGLPARR